MCHVPHIPLWAPFASTQALPQRRERNTSRAHCQLAAPIQRTHFTHASVGPAHCPRPLPPPLFLPPPSSTSTRNPPTLPFKAPHRLPSEGHTCRQRPLHAWMPREFGRNGARGGDKALLAPVARFPRGPQNPSKSGREAVQNSTVTFTTR